MIPFRIATEPVVQEKEKGEEIKMELKTQIIHFDRLKPCSWLLRIYITTVCLQINQQEKI